MSRSPKGQVFEKLLQKSLKATSPKYKLKLSWNIIFAFFRITKISIVPCIALKRYTVLLARLYLKDQLVISNKPVCPILVTFIPFV